MRHGQLTLGALTMVSILTGCQERTTTTIGTGGTSCARGYMDPQEFSWEPNAPVSIQDQFEASSSQTVGWHHRAIETAAAWQTGMTGEGVIVAVIDTGVDISHPDLAGRLWVNAREIPNNGIDDDGNGIVDDIHGAAFLVGQTSGNPVDDQGHGTHVAGIIAASDNGFGSIGVAPKAKVMSLKFMDSAGRGYINDALRAIDYAVANGATIINMSWGGPYRSEALRSKIAQYEEKGIIFVAAAGNDRLNMDTSPSFPAGYALNNLIAVGATELTNGQERSAGFSNFGGTSVHTFAPGSVIYSTVRNHGYTNLSGTSMAAPVVVGSLALIQQALSVKESRPPSIASIATSYLLSYGEQINSGVRSMTSSRMNVSRAIQAVNQDLPVVLPATLRTTPEAGLPLGVYPAGSTVEVVRGDARLINDDQILMGNESATLQPTSALGERGSAVPYYVVQAPEAKGAAAPEQCN